MRDTIYLFHDVNQTREGVIAEFEDILRGRIDGEFHRPELPLRDGNTQDSVRFVRSLNIPVGSTLVGLGVGGLLAGVMQELSPERGFIAVAICSPVEYDGLALTGRVEDTRVAFSGTTGSDWSPYTNLANRLSVLDKGYEQAKFSLCDIVGGYLNGNLPSALHFYAKAITPGTLVSTS